MYFLRVSCPTLFPVHNNDTEMSCKDGPVCPVQMRDFSLSLFGYSLSLNKLSNFQSVAYLQCLFTEGNVILRDRLIPMETKGLLHCCHCCFLHTV